MEKLRYGEKSDSKIDFKWNINELEELSKQHKL